MLWALGYIWALPTTLIGFILALGGFCKPIAFKNGAIWFQVTNIGPWHWWARYFAAIALGGVIILAPRIKPEWVAKHELRHFAQARLLGPLFIPVYLMLGLWMLLRRKDAYWDNPLEQDARRVAGEL